MEWILIVIAYFPQVPVTDTRSIMRAPGTTQVIQVPMGSEAACKAAGNELALQWVRTVRHSETTGTMPSEAAEKWAKALTSVGCYPTR